MEVGCANSFGALLLFPETFGLFIVEIPADR